MEIVMEPIGYVTSSRTAPYDDDWDQETTVITLDSRRFGPAALRGLDQFSHAEILYWFDQVAPGEISYGSRRPRGNPRWPEVGVFAQRGKNRPNRIGTTITRVVRLTDLTLEVSGLDAIDGTPVLDIKPHMAEFGPRGPVRQPRWATELMREYWTSSR